MSDEPYKIWLCLGCGFSYDEALGSEEAGLAPGTRWADVPDDWCCPDCGTPKHLFEMVQIGYSKAQLQPAATVAPGSFVLRANERGDNTILSTGATAAYVGGHPDAFVKRRSSFNFHEYQQGRAGFGRMRVFGDEEFHHPGCSYSMHPHHNFIICAFVLEGRLIHVNTAGKVDELGPGDFYAFSAGSGGKHTEINIGADPMKAIYIWLLPDQLLRPPSYARSHFDADAGKNRITPLIGDGPGALPARQDCRISRLSTQAPGTHVYRPRSSRHGVYAFVLEGEVACDGTPLGRRDSKGVWGVEAVSFEAGDGAADILIVETVM